MERGYYIKNLVINQDHADLLQVLTSISNLFSDEEAGSSSLRSFLYDSRHAFFHTAEAHIRREEALFINYNMPQQLIDLQRGEHGKFMLMFDDFFSNLSELGRYQIAAKAKELKTEVLKHIGGIDTEMNNYINDEQADLAQW